MKKIGLLLIILCVISNAFAGGDEKQRIEFAKNAKSKTLLIVLDSLYDEESVSILKESLDKYWNFSKYQLVDYEFAKNNINNENYCFLIIDFATNRYDDSRQTAKILFGKKKASTFFDLWYKSPGCPFFPFSNYNWLSKNRLKPFLPIMVIYFNNELNNAFNGRPSNVYQFSIFESLNAKEELQKKTVIYDKEFASSINRTFPKSNFDFNSLIAGYESKLKCSINFLEVENASISDYLNKNNGEYLLVTSFKGQPSGVGKIKDALIVIIDPLTGSVIWSGDSD